MPRSLLVQVDQNDRVRGLAHGDRALGRRSLVASSPMAYLKAGALGLLTAIGLGAATGIWRLLVLAFEHLRPEDRAMVLAPSISEAINNAAFLATLLVPAGLLVAFAVRRRRNRPGAVQLPE